MIYTLDQDFIPDLNLVTIQIVADGSNPSARNATLSNSTQIRRKRAQRNNRKPAWPEEKLFSLGKYSLVYPGGAPTRRPVTGPD